MLPFKPTALATRKALVEKRQKESGTKSYYKHLGCKTALYYKQPEHSHIQEEISESNCNNATNNQIVTNAIGTYYEYKQLGQT